MSDARWDFIKASYVISAVKQEQYPEGDMPEVAFIGRSNVGKSSLINSLCKTRGLAKVSGTPGKTRTINFFTVQAKHNSEPPLYEKLFLVDLPGYGFAKASKSDKKDWAVFIKRYITGSERLVKVYQLIDVRHSLMKNDLECYTWLTGLGADVKIIFTKADKLSQSAASKNRAGLCKELSIPQNETILYSSVKNTGRQELIDNVMIVCKE